MDKEDFVISQFRNKFIGDDGAVVSKFVFVKDLFVENTHFKRNWLSLEEIAYKAMIVNISDIIVMNALPKYALLGLCLPKDINNAEIKLLSKGFKRACDEFNIQIIGGDTTGGDFIGIGVSLVGTVRGKAIYRKNAKMGEILCFSGCLGRSLKNLRTLKNGGLIASKSKFKKPVLRQKFFYKIAPFISAAMDISDGLSHDLKHLTRKKGVKFIKKLSKFELNSGEEYEILFSVNPRNLPRILNEAKKFRLKVTPFAKIIRGKYKSYGNFKHFK